MRSEKFCCCLPVRFGVFILSLLQTASSVLLAGILFYALSQKNVHYESSQRIAMVVVGVIMSILALVSFCGFLGSLFARRSLVRTFKFALQILLAISIVSGIITLIFLFRTSNEKLIETCKENAASEGITDTSFCKNVTVYRIATCIVLGVTWFIHIYEVVIVTRYLQQLEWEKEQRWHMASLKSFAGQQQPFMPYSKVSTRGDEEAYPRPPSDYHFKGSAA